MAPSTRPDARPLLVDLGLLGAVAVVLVAVHSLVPAGVRNGLALQYADPDPFHAFTAAYVHLTDAHLRGNVAGFLLAGGVAAWLAHLAGQRRWFHLSLLACLTVLPVAVGMTAAAVVDAGVVSRGASGVVAGLVGVVLVSPGVVFRRAFGSPPWVGWNAVAALVIVVGAEIVWVVRGTIPPVIGGVLAVGLVLTLGQFAVRARHLGAVGVEGDFPQSLVGAVLTALVVLAVLTAFVVGLFPAELVGADGVTNILAHYLGLVYGAVIAGWGSRYWSERPAGPRGNRRS